MKAAVFAFTKKGVLQSEKLLAILKKSGYSVTIYTTKDYALKIEECDVITPNLKTIAEQTMKDCKLIIFVGSLGIAVRIISPFIMDKTKDPAVLCIDDLGRYVIPVLSGHIGGANAIAKSIAAELNAEAIITTATDISGVFSVDEWATRNGMYICNVGQVKRIAKNLLDGLEVGLLTRFQIEGGLPKNVVLDKKCEAGICISLDEEDKPFEYTLNLIPKIIYIGIGCRKDSEFEKIEKAVFEVLNEENISIHAVGGIGSIDLKKNEQGLLQFENKYRLSTTFYAADELQNAKGEFTGSDFVKKITKVDNVCERAAVLLADGGKLIRNKTVIDGVTIALAKSDWSVSFEN